MLPEVRQFYLELKMGSALTAWLQRKLTIVKKKNTRGSTLHGFIRELETAEQEFYKTTEILQHWANTSIVHVNVKAMLDKL